MLESIAIIPDGNRRYAFKNNIPLFEAYSTGTKKAFEIVDWLKDFKELKVVSFYTLSYKNFTERSKEELNVLSKVLEKQLDYALEENFFSEKNLAIKFIGNLDVFDKKIVKKMKKLEKDSSETNASKTIVSALAYDGQNEIVEAAKKFALETKNEKNQELSVNSFKKFLQFNFKEPDLVIRTSGMNRLSGFLTFSSAYSELYFSKLLWPEFDKKELMKAVSFYNTTQRNFGK